MILGYHGRTDIINKHLVWDTIGPNLANIIETMYTMLMYANNHDFNGIIVGDDISLDK